MDKANATEKGTKTFLGYLKGHKGEVTSMVSGNQTADGTEGRIFISGSRDKTILIWKLNPSEEEAEKSGQFGEPFMALKGHSHFVSDLAITKENTHLFSASWDKTMRLWDLKTAKCVQKFLNAPKEITSLAISAEARKIYTSGLDNSIGLWNNKGQLMESSKAGNHQDWISRVRFSPSLKNEYLATAGWDGRLKVWVGNFTLKSSFIAHDGPINALAIATNGLFIATGGKDQMVKIWKLNDLKEAYIEQKVNSTVNDIAFNTHLKIFAVASDDDVFVYSMDQVVKEPKIEINGEEKKVRYTSVAWSANGKNLFCGCSNGDIAVYRIEIN